MSCEELFGRMGFSCSKRGNNTYRIDTPISFPNGEPISLYFIDRGNSVLVSDNADTLFHLSSVGMDLSDRKKWRGVSQIANTFGIKLENTGAVTGLALASGAHDLVARFIGAMLAIAEMEREYVGLTDEMALFIDEVEMHLRVWKPNESIERYPQIKGHSGRVHTFHFHFGNELIEAAKPHSNKTGSILRKAADIQNAAIPLGIMIVMDDREDPERAKAETDILSTLVKVLPFSRLSKNLSGSSH